MGRILAMLVGLVAVLLVGVVAVVFIQGRRSPRQDGEYIALGSSFAAGLGLGPRDRGSPIVCQRSSNGYPQLLARMTGLRLVDMTCSGATVDHVLDGGQFFQGPQVAAIGPGTRLVTLTAGGNDVHFVGDLTIMAFAQRDGIVGWLARRFARDSRSLTDRGFDALQTKMTAALREIRRRAPAARIVVVTYPSIVPPDGTCAAIGISANQASRMREVARRLDATMRAVAAAAGADLIDMARLSADHDACSADPWVNGTAPQTGAPFHPTLAGAKATASAIKRLLDKADIREKRR